MADGSRPLSRIELEGRSGRNSGVRQVQPYSLAFPRGARLSRLAQPRAGSAATARHNEARGCPGACRLLSVYSLITQVSGAVVR